MKRRVRVNKGEQRLTDKEERVLWRLAEYFNDEQELFREVADALLQGKVRE